MPEASAEKTIYIHTGDYPIIIIPVSKRQEIIIILGPGL
jgi:hypothetical protein